MDGTIRTEQVNEQTIKCINRVIDSRLTGLENEGKGKVARAVVKHYFPAPKDRETPKPTS